MFALPTTCSPVLTFALKAAEPASTGTEVPASLTSDEKEAILALQLHRYGVGKYL